MFRIKDFETPYGPFKIVIQPTDTKWLHEDMFAVKWLVEIGFESPKDKLQFIEQDDDKIEAPQDELNND